MTEIERQRRVHADNGVRTQEARDDEREALIAILDDPTNWWYNGTHTVFSPSRGADALIAAGYRKHPEPEITKDMVQAAAMELGDRFGHSGEEYLEDARAALEAALRVPVGEGDVPR